MDLGFDLETELMSNGFAEPAEEPSSPGEIHTAALGRVLDEDLSISSNIHEWTNHNFKNRNQQLDEMLASGKLPESYKELVGTYMSYSELATIAKDKYGLDVMSDKDVYATIRGDLQNNEAYAQSVYDRAPWYNKPFKLTGMLHGFAIDPINAVGMLLGVGPTARGASYISKLAINAGKTSAIFAAQEAAIQPFVYNWKNKVGIDYDVSDAVKNILLSAGVGGAFEVSATLVKDFIKAGARFTQTHTLKRLAASDPAAREAVTLLDNTLAELEKLDPNTPVREHFERMDEYIKAQDNAGPLHGHDVDVSSNLDSDTVNDVYNLTFEQEVKNTPYVEDIRGLGSDQEIVIGDARVRSQELDTKVAKLEEFASCAKGVKRTTP